MLPVTQPRSHRALRQASLPGLCPIEAAVSHMAASGIEARGAIFTRREVVDFILDLIGYTHNVVLAECRLLEPSFGNGDFLLPAVERLIDSFRSHAAKGERMLDALYHSVRAVELHAETFEATRRELGDFLSKHEVRPQVRDALLDAWLIQGDFLLTDLPHSFTHVVGNPPYVRQELIPDALMAEYRRRFATIFDRADIYVPFIEHSLEHLVPGGMVGFICADRWMKNRYGGPLRKLVSERFHLKYYVDMVDTPAFHADVIAYPAITVIAAEQPGVTRVAHRPAIDIKELTTLAKSLRKGGAAMNGHVTEIANVTAGEEPWVLDSFDHLAIARRLEQMLPTLEEAGCKVGIGVATGADEVFIDKFDALNVEPDRKLPLVMTRDIAEGTVAWRGFGVINPFGDDGTLVPLASYPKLAAYFSKHEAAIRGRHTSKKNPNGWYRTIDRIYPDLTHRPKLLIPDIKGKAHIVFEEGKLYPHHNLYYVVADDWDLRALQAVLLSKLARLFIGLYSTKMRGGYLRFQAQYLRRIRIPHWRDVSPALRKRLANAAIARDFDACNAAVFDLYKLNAEERAALEE